MLTDHKSSISTQRGYHISDQGHSDPYQGGNTEGYYQWEVGQVPTKGI